MKDDKIAIYYIATGKYIKFIDDFKRHLGNFMPEYKKIIVLLTDSTEDYSYLNDDTTEIRQSHIDHFCWPIVALFKMKYILDHPTEAKYTFYMNSNCHWKDGANVDLNKDLILGSFYKNVDYRVFNCKQKPESTSYIDYNNLPVDIQYLQSGFFGGKTEVVMKVCNDIDSMLRIDLLNRVIPEWHDESYLNKWAYLNYWFNREDNIDIIRLNDVCEFINKYIPKEEV